MVPLALVLAHGGGVPEAATIGLPLVIVAGFIWAEKKARKRERDNPQSDAPGAAGPPAPDSD